MHFSIKSLFTFRYWRRGKRSKNSLTKLQNFPPEILQRIVDCVLIDFPLVDPRPLLQASHTLRECTLRQLQKLRIERRTLLASHLSHAWSSGRTLSDAVAELANNYEPAPISAPLPQHPPELVTLAQHLISTYHLKDSLRLVLVLRPPFLVLQDFAYEGPKSLHKLAFTTLEHDLFEAVASKGTRIIVYVNDDSKAMRVYRKCRTKFQIFNMSNHRRKKVVFWMAATAST